MALLLLAAAAYCVAAAPIFSALGGRSEVALVQDALLCRSLVYVAVGTSLWGAAVGALSLALRHAEVDRRWLALVGLAAGLLVPVLAVLALFWCWEFIARAHGAGL